MNISSRYSVLDIANVPPSPPERIEGDFLGVTESSSLIQLSRSHESLAESGYIMTTSGPVFATALVDESQGENLITQEFAASHKLKVDFLDPDSEEGVRVKIDGGKSERCIGSVKLSWSIIGEAYNPPFPVHCWVVTHGIGNLMFGQRFLDKKNHYLNSGRG